MHWAPLGGAAGGGGLTEISTKNTPSGGRRHITPCCTCAQTDLSHFWTSRSSMEPPSSYGSGGSWAMSASSASAHSCAVTRTQRQIRLQHAVARRTQQHSGAAPCALPLRWASPWAHGTRAGRRRRCGSSCLYSRRAVMRATLWHRSTRSRVAPVSTSLMVKVLPGVISSMPEFDLPSLSAHEMKSGCAMLPCAQ